MSLAGGTSISAAAAAAGAVGSFSLKEGTVFPFSERVSSNRIDTMIQPAVTNLLNNLANIGSEEEGSEEAGLSIVRQNLEKYQTSSESLSDIIDRGRFVSSDLGMLTLGDARTRIFDMLLNEDSAALVERSGQLKFWVQVLCIMDVLVGDKATVQRVGLEYVPC